MLQRHQGLELAGFDPFQASRVLEFRVSPFVKDVEHQLMLQTAPGSSELAGFDPFQASRVLEFRVSPFVKVVKHQFMLQTAYGSSN